MRAGMVALVLLLVPLLPIAVAQAPQACGPIAASASSAAPTQAGGETEVVVTVQNQGNQAAQVTVAANVATEGWTLVSDTSQTASVAAGSSNAFSFRLRALDDASRDGRVTFATSGDCPPPAGLPCPANACTTQASAVSADLPLQAQEGFRIPGLDDLGFPVEYLAAGVLLILVAVAIPLVVRRRGGGAILLTCPEPLKPVKAGRGASFPVELKNSADEPMQLGLEVGTVPDGWSAFLPVPEIQLAPKESRALWLMVRAPPAAKTGDKADVEVRAARATRPDKPVVLRVRAEVMEGVADSTA